MKSKGYKAYQVIPKPAIKKLSPAVKNVINYASKTVTGECCIGSIHLLLGMIGEQSASTVELFKKRGLQYDVIKDSVTTADAEPAEKRMEHISQIFEYSLELSRQIGDNSIDVAHLLFALIKCDFDLTLSNMLIQNKISVFDLYSDISSEIGQRTLFNQNRQAAINTSLRATPMLDKYGTDLTKKAEAGELNRVIGRNKDIDRIIQILLRKNKNSPCIIAEPGTVDKNEIFHELANRIINNDVPPVLRNKRLILLDVIKLTHDKLEMTLINEVDRLLEELINNPDIILIIDWFHILTKLEKISPKIKLFLWEHNVQFIGATVPKSYKDSVETDEIYSRYFQKTDIAEPSAEDAIMILRELKSQYEAHHNVRISDSAITAAVELSVRYIKDRFLPDKAMNVIDEAASKARLTANSEHTITVTEEHVSDIITELTGIPVKKLMNDETQNLIDLEKTLQKRIVGQAEAVNALSRAIRRNRAGLRDPKRPIGSFLFLGSTGVGKTELCKTLAHTLFRSDDAMIRFDMSEYMERHRVSNLIGSPPGYVGSDKGGWLTEQIKQKPYSVVLFDEIEKAHPDIFNILLQILEDGTLSDAHGQRVDFKNAIIIMTSNIGAEDNINARLLGFSNQDTSVQESEVQKANTMKSLQATFRPELINRFDEIIFFNKLTGNEIKEITLRMLNEIKNRVSALGIGIEFDPKCIDSLSTEGYDPKFGARPLRRTIQRTVEDSLASELLSGRIKAGDNIKAEWSGKEIIYTAA